MLPSPRSLDPDGLYACLGIEPAATPPQVATAFRMRARVLHPDVPRTGDAAAFVQLKQAYDILSDPERRAAYDRRAEQEIEAEIEELLDVPPPPPPPPVTLWSRVLPRLRRIETFAMPRLLGLPIAVWVGMGAVLTLGMTELAAHLWSAPKLVESGIRPNAPTVAPLSPSAHLAVLYGPAPVHLAGIPNAYVTPGPAPAALWRRDPARGGLERLADLPAFSTVQAIGVDHQSGMMAVLDANYQTSLIAADRLAPGDQLTARRAYCAFNAGPAPQDGEVLEKRSSGGATLTVDNRAPQPAVVKLRDPAGTVLLSLFLNPGAHTEVGDLADGTYQAEFSVGELWSRACNGFTTEARTGRMDDPTVLPEASIIVVAPDGGGPSWTEIPEQAFERE